MHFIYETIQIIERNNRIKIKGYKYWILLSGHGNIITANEKFSFMPHEIMEFPSGSIIMVSAVEAMNIGIMTLEDFKATNTRIRHYPAHMTDLVRKTFYYGLELRGTVHPYISRIQQNLDQIMGDIVLSLPHTMLVDSPVLFPIITQINQRYEDCNLHIGDILKTSSYSQAYIRRIFLKETGLSPTEYMNNLRIEKAKKLLTDNSQESSISDIAEQCGIKDPFYFSRIFKKFTGDTPSEYRRKVAPKVRP